MPYKNKEQQRKFQREHKAARRIKWLQENGPCKCGSWEELEVDHIDPNLKVDHKIWTWRKERRDVELAKCQVLCKKCHKEKTLLQISHLPSQWQHGTHNCYATHGCRCEPCRQGQAEYQRKWNKGKYELG